MDGERTGDARQEGEGLPLAVETPGPRLDCPSAAMINNDGVEGQATGQLYG